MPPNPEQGVSKPVAGRSRAAAWLHQSLMLIKVLSREVG
jgi:hypothetical protein